MKTKLSFWLVIYIMFVANKSQAAAEIETVNQDVFYTYSMLDVNTYSDDSGFTGSAIQWLWDESTGSGVNDSKATGDVEAWVEFDFGQEEEIATAKLWQDNGGNRVTHWKVMTWVDGEWKDVFPYVVSNTSGWQTQTFDIKATKIRFYAKCASNGFVSIHELQLLSKPSSEPRKVQIGCIGDSNTYGAGVTTKAQYAWPIQLCNILGRNYKVMNLGESGTTLQSAPADKPWIAGSQYPKCKVLNANIVIIALGTNDSKSYNWPATAPALFSSNYIDLIKEIQAYPSKPELYMLLPIKAFSGNFNINNTVIQQEILPIMREISKTVGVALIDGYTATENISSLFPDGIHANDEGSKIIAEKVASILQTKKPILSVDGKLSTASYAAYRWYKDGVLLPEATSSTYIANTGVYKVAVKLTEVADDVIVSNEFVVTGEAVNLVVSDQVVGKVDPALATKPIVLVSDNCLIVKGNAGMNFQLFDIAGKKLKTVVLESDNDRIDLSQLATGIYLYKVGRSTGKIIK